MEWNGFEHDMARKHGSLKTTTMYEICPGANINTLTLIQKSLYDIGIVHEHIFIDVQLFAATRLNGIFNSKSWVKALRSYKSVASSHLKRFPSRGPKLFEPVDEYLGTAWAHPTGPQWVYNFLLPTLLIHQFEHVE